MRWLRYPVLVLFIVAALAGVGSVFQLLAPYSAYGRIATMLFQPVWKAGNNVLGYLAERADSYAFYTVDVWLKSLPVLIIAVVTLVVLAVLAGVVAVLTATPSVLWVRCCRSWPASHG